MMERTCVIIQGNSFGIFKHSISNRKYTWIYDYFNKYTITSQVYNNGWEIIDYLTELYWKVWNIIVGT